MYTHHWSKRDPSATQTNATWGLGRISHRKPGSSEYLYDTSSGEGVCAYIIDTGLQTKHPEFEGRATLVEVLDHSDGTDLDMFGHGTHVAGTIGSKSYGVAKKAKLLGIKVCNALGACDVSNVGKAIEIAIKDSKQRDCPNGAVINMSLGAPKGEWKSILKATGEASDAGIFVAVSAGNSYADSTEYLPASAPTVCTVGATDNADVIAVFSNYGKPVKVFAPGVDVLSTYSFNGTIETVRSNWGSL
jgi:subtilisin family serine protease